MFARSLSLKAYRNYDALNILLDKGTNIFLGKNAQGKTNVMEAVFYASFGRSHRTNQDADLIKWEETYAAIDLSFERMGVTQKISFRFQKGKRREILGNGAKISRSELIGRFHAVLFAPEDLYLVKGAPQQRRRFLDREISQASPAYFKELVRYTRIVDQRNSLLKKIREGEGGRELLEFFDAELAESAEKITARRMEAVADFSEIAGNMQEQLSKGEERLTVSYLCKGRGTQDMTKPSLSWYNEMIRNAEEKDILRGTTSIGPHHDDLVFKINGVELKAFGSQGQQRTSILSLKLSEMAFLRRETGEHPVLLLDDVMSELDVHRREALLSFMEQEGIQTIITATDAAYFPPALEHRGKRFHVEAGRVYEV